MELIKKHFFNLVVGVLLVIILIQQCSRPVEISVPTVVRDTVWVVKDSLIVSKPQVIKTISVTSHDTVINHYIPDTNYARLAIQYQKVVDELLAKNVHQDSIRIDSTGYVKITDTVQKNLLVGRSTEVNIKHPIIKEVITLPAKKVNQLYVGGAFQTNLQNQQVGVGALLKTRNDFLFGGSLSVNTYGDFMYGVQSYWKLKLK
jgi:hypothetical protein